MKPWGSTLNIQNICNYVMILCFSKTNNNDVAADAAVDDDDDMLLRSTIMCISQVINDYQYINYMDIICDCLLSFDTEC